ncbi:MAG: phosphotransferase family protein [Haloarculaceae archaeon]
MTDEHSEEYFRRIVDEDALAEKLEEELGAADEYEVRRHGEGHSNETLFVTWGDMELVIRRPPPGETAESAHDVLREYTVMNALQDTEVRVPNTLFACEDHSIIGSDFYVMEREEGIVIRGEEPEQFAEPRYREEIGRELVDGLAEIHKVDYEEVGLGEFGYPDGFTERQVERWGKQLDWAFEVTEEEREVPKLQEVGDWLEANIPEDYPHTLVHGDYKLDNVMFDESPPPEIISVFDWEMSTLGDPFTDLGWVLVYWWDPKDPAPPRTDLDDTFMKQEGYLTRLDLVEQYEELTGFEFENERFYRTLAVYKLAGLGEMFFRRHLEGNADDDMYPQMREGVPKMADRAMRIIEGEEPL